MLDPKNSKLDNMIIKNWNKVVLRVKNRGAYLDVLLCRAMSKYNWAFIKINGFLNQ